MLILSREEIERRLEGAGLVPLLERAFVAWSSGEAVVPPPGEMLFEAPAGEVHVKFGWIRGAERYVVKVASGFPGNADQGLPTSDGLMLLFDRRTGRPTALLQDEGRLTDLRTAVAGAVCAKHLGPATVDRVGVLGTGIQAELQVRRLQEVRPCRRVTVWGRTPERVAAYRERLGRDGFDVETAASPAEVAERCRLIVCATASTAPLMRAADVRPGTHVTAVGADTPEKRELASDLLARADRLVVDSRTHAPARGEIRHALADGAIKIERLSELGEIIGEPRPRDPGDVTVATLTGLAVQDLAIAEAVLAGGGPLRPA